MSTEISFPTSIDNDENLYLVRDSLRLILAKDYNPGDTTIQVEEDEDTFNKFPSSGILTLTEQCSDIDERAISFFYQGKGSFTFTNLQPLPNFTLNKKDQRITRVTMNVMAEHHNNLKDAIIAIERFVGVKGEVSLTPLEGTLEARINFLRKLVLKPTAWFIPSKSVGILPLCLTFRDFSTRMPDIWYWDFGDGTGMSVTRSPGISVGDVSKCYYTPGKYDVTLTVVNDFGTNAITLPQAVVARIAAPDEATISITPTTSQILQPSGVLRSAIAQSIQIDVSSNGEQPLDPILRYIWEIQDDLVHENTTRTFAQFSIGGVYDVKLNTQTNLGAYRITTFEDILDIVEKTNLWHFIFPDSSSSVTKSANFYEFGLISETYKLAAPTSLSVTRNFNFLNSTIEETRQKREFLRNNGFAVKSLTDSGSRGDAVLFWAEGAADTITNQTIRFKEFNGFDQTFTTPSINGGPDTITRQWNWFCWDTTEQIAIMLGAPGPGTVPPDSPTLQTLTVINSASLSLTNTAITSSFYTSGADELEYNVGNGTDGDFSVYRTAWLNDAGYLVRNDGSGTFFRLKSFYVTGTTSAINPIENINKIDSLVGQPKLEGQLVALQNGVYFFNNTGEVLVFNPTTASWQLGGPGVNSPTFTTLQDITSNSYDNVANTLIATSDYDTNAYLFYDYSTKAQIHFSSVDNTMKVLPARPNGEQFLIGSY